MSLKKIKHIIYKNLPTDIRSIIELGYIPRIKYPSGYNSKMQSRMKSTKNPLFGACSDKIAVRSYVANKLGSEYLIPLLEIFNDGNNIVIKDDHFPCVLKANHNSGPVYILRDRSDVTNEKIDSIKKQLKINYGKVYGENWYGEIVPRAFVESMIGVAGKIPEDFKFHVFNYKNKSPKVVLQVDYDRFGSHNRTFYDENLNVLPFSVTEKNEFKKIDHIPQFNEMLKAAIVLASDFDYVRVDLYNCDGKIYFGELTFSHQAGLAKFTPENYDKVFGEYWEVLSNGILSNE